MTQHALVKAFLFVDLLGVSLVVPLLPAIALGLGMSQTALGLSMTLYGVMQIISAPVVLRWSDRVDARLLLAASSGCTALSYLLLCLSRADRIVLFWIARALAGVSRHSSSLSKTFLHGEVNLGDLQLLSSLAFIIGPLAGGRLPLVVSCLASVALLSVAACMSMLLPAPSAAATAATTVVSVAPVPAVLPMKPLARSGVSTFAASLYSSALFSQNDTRTAGNLRSLAAASNVVALLVARRWGSLAAATLALTLSVLVLLLPFQPVMLIGMASCGALLSRSLSSSLLSASGAGSRGGLVGLDDALGSVARAGAPLLAGVMLDYVGGMPVYMLTSFLFIIVAMV